MTNSRRSTVSDQIADAFIAILSKKAFMDITVSDVVNAAGVARASFYRNFSSTSDVLDYALQRIVTTLHQLAMPALGSNDRKIWKDFLNRFIHFLLDSEQEYLLIRSENLSLVLNRLIEMMRSFFPADDPVDLSEKYRPFAKLSLVNGVLLLWRENGMKESVDQIIDFLCDTICSF